jgi:hypothetical protein
MEEILWGLEDLKMLLKFKSSRPDPLTFYVGRKDKKNKGHVHHRCFI